MNEPWGALILAAFFFALGTFCIIAAWHHYSSRIDTYIETMIDKALARKLPKRFRDLDEEMRQLVLDEHNNE